MSAVVAFQRARDHPRWRSLVEVPDQDLKEGLTSSNVRAPALPKSDAAGSRTRETAGVAASDRSEQVPAGSPLGPNYSAHEHTLRNDYSQHFVDTGAGQLPGNAVRNPFAHSRFDEYPKLKRLVQLKDSLVTSVAHAPTYLKTDLRPSLQPYRNSSRNLTDEFHLGSLIPVKYDVVLIDPPLECYEWESRASASTGQTWSWDEVAALPVPQVAAKESFVFLWVGSGAGDGLERGREVLAKWGYRRCEDIVCIRVNPPADPSDGSHQQPSSSSAFTRCSQHCLMGIRGTVRRSTDTRFVHCNIDTDVILWDGQDDHGSQRVSSDADPNAAKMVDLKRKPAELYQIIENFCLGTRRLELFGCNRNLRRGWLTVGLDVGPDAPGWPLDGKVDLPVHGLSVLQEHALHDATLSQHLDALRQPQEYVKVEYDANFSVDRPGCDLRDRSNLVPFSEEVDQLRPKSPPPRGTVGASGTVTGDRTGDASVIRPDARLSVGVGMPSGLSNNPLLRNQRNVPGPPGHPTLAAAGPIIAAAPGLLPAIPSPFPMAGYGAMPVASTALVDTNGNMRPVPLPGGAGLSGLGAGGPRTVSVPSGSDTLSGPQASVLKAKAAAEAASAKQYPITPPSQS